MANLNDELAEIANADTGDNVVDNKTDPDELVFVEPDRPHETDMFNSIAEANLAAEALTDKISDLLDVMSDIVSVKGMSQSFALEAEKIIPNFGNVPIGYYTKTPTMTRYRVSLEEMSKGIWALIAAVLAVIAGLLVKVFYFFTGKKDATAKDAEKCIDDQIDNIKETVTTVDKTANLINEGDAVLRNAKIPCLDENENAFYCTSFQIAIDRLLVNNERYGAAKNFLKLENPIYRDIIKFGRYSKAANEIGLKVNAINDLLKIKLESMLEVINTNLHSTNTIDDLNNAKVLKTLNVPVVINVSGKQMTLDETADYLTGIRHAVSNETGQSDINFDTMFNSISRIYSTTKIVEILKAVKNSFKVLSDMQKQVDAIKGINRNISTDGIVGGVGVDVGHALRETIKTLSDDISNFNSIYAELHLFANTIDRLTNEAYGFATILVGKITSEMRANEQEIPESWIKVTNELKVYKQIIKKNFIENKR